MPKLHHAASVLDGADRGLGKQIRRDQLEAVRSSVLNAIPINMLLGVTATLVAVHTGVGMLGASWLAASTSVNILRIALCRAPCLGLSLSEGMPPEMAQAAERSVDDHLRLACLIAFLSGLVWACLPVLCDGYRSTHAIFYLTVTCGITAGAVTHGIAYARIPTCFIVPPLLSVAGCLVAQGAFESLCLAATVLLYLFALVRSAAKTERSFREASRLKHEARALALASDRAHASAQELADQMSHRATHDGLTGLLNRTGFERKAEAIVGGETECCLLLLDLDGFKSVNDLYGHKRGDGVLIEVARRIEDVLPPRCLTARFGGDEFAILYPLTGGAVAPADLAHRLIQTVADRFETFDAGRLGLSIGVCHLTGTTLTEMLSCADEALYVAKASGRNRHHTFDEALHARATIRRDSKRDLPQALADGHLEVWFQPIYRRSDQRIACFEALLRWRHPVHGWIAPPDILTAAALSGLTESLLRFILENVCDLMVALSREGRDDVSVALNVSPREMAQVPVDEIILQRLRALGLPPNRLEIEITEETALDIKAVQSKLAALTEAGIRIALDDFGTGYSSLASLRRLGTRRVKIDRSLVTGLSESEDQRGMIQAVLSLGRALDLEVVAEGIEGEADLRTLTGMGCPFLQGYHLGRPIPAAEALRLESRLVLDAA